MRVLRTITPQTEVDWYVEDVMSYLGCDEQKAKSIMKECRNCRNLGGYGPIEKHILLDFIEEKQRIEREREARYKSDIANAENTAVLKEQVKALREQNVTLRKQEDALRDMIVSSSEDARKARCHALVANCISFLALVIAFIALALKLN